MYTLAGIANTHMGWGRDDESWAFMEALALLGGPAWFKLGDKDLATNVLRTAGLRSGRSLEEVTRQLCGALKIGAAILPMTNDSVRTLVHSDEGTLAFQRYFVERQSAPRVERFEFEGIETAVPNAAFLSALRSPDLEAVVICPSNPFISIDPILSLTGVREALRRCHAPVIAISPVVAGKAIKGPTVKMMSELGMTASARAVAEYYGDILDGFVIDSSDPCSPNEFSCSLMRAPTIMNTLADKEALAERALGFAKELCQP